MILFRFQIIPASCERGLRKFSSVSDHKTSKMSTTGNGEFNYETEYVDLNLRAVL